MTLTKAIHQAKQSVTMHRFGNQWQVNVYSDRHNAWWQGQSMVYRVAREHYSRIVVRVALEALGVDQEEAWFISEDYKASGSIVDRVREGFHTWNTATRVTD